MHRITILSLFIFALSLMMTQPAMACSGGPPPWNDWLPMILERTDVVVTGSYARLDDLNVNGIFRVDQYVVGSGPEYLLIQALDHQRIENDLFVHRSYASCGDRRIRDVLSEHGRYTYFLVRGRDGIYSIDHSRYFADPQATTSVWDRDRGEVKLTAAAFHTQVADVAETRLHSPDPDTFEPRTTPIVITTASGRQYLLPVDSTELVSISDEEVVELRQDQTECRSPCIAYSPNKLDKVYLRSSGEAPDVEYGLSPVVESAAVGERIAFSATSDTYALWHDGQIHIHALWYPALGYPDDWLGAMYQPTESLNATPAGDSAVYPVAWSPDGRTLAFSTEDGLWLWDALTSGSSPDLLVRADDAVPVVRYFSPQGRYIAITNGPRHYTLDLMNRTELPDGIVSPNDRILLAHDMNSDTPSPLEVIYLAPGPRQATYYPEVQYRHVQWMDDRHFVASISGFGYLNYQTEYYQDPDGVTHAESIPLLVEESFVDVATYHSSGIIFVQNELLVPFSLSEIQMRDFTYQSGHGLIEVGADGYHLSVKGQLIDLTSELPDQIESVAWLLPYGFYFNND